MSATQMAWACFGQWLEIATQQSNGDISGVDLSTWAKWYGEGLDPVQAASRYRVGARDYAEPGRAQ